MEYLVTCLIIGALIYAVHPEGQTMTTPIDRLRDKFLKASGVAQRVATNMEAEADALIAEEDKMKAETEAAFAPHKAILAEGRAELTQIKDALNIMSNGGPPLTDAGSTAPGSVSADTITVTPDAVGHISSVLGSSFDHATGDPIR